MMKYIVFLNESTKQEEIMVFPKSINHDCFAEGAHFRNQTSGNWNRVFRKPISAGFVGSTPKGLVCLGESMSLNLKSRPEIDTTLLNNELDKT